MARIGAESTKLVVLRGNSGSGKSTTAHALRAVLGRGVALVEQDYLRRIVLRELDVVDGRNIGLIDQTARYALDCGYSVILEGILSAERYRGLLAALHRDHRGQTAFYYFDVSLEETLRRHASRPQSAEFGPDLIRRLYRDRDLLDFTEERIIDQTDTLGEIVDRIHTEVFPRWVPIDPETTPAELRR